MDFQEKSRVQIKVSQITRITQRPSGRHPPGLGVAALRWLSQISQIPQISQIGFAALIGFHRLKLITQIPAGWSLRNPRNLRDFIIPGRMRTRRGASLQVDRSRSG